MNKIQKIVVATGMLMLGGGNVATAYYVDQIAGNDGNSGLSAGQAWKTCSKVNGFTFHSKASVLFNKGCNLARVGNCSC